MHTVYAVKQSTEKSMQAIKEIHHIKNKQLHMRVPESFDNLDVEVIVRPSHQKNRTRFDPSVFCGITDVPFERIQNDTKDLRAQWNRHI